jgi:hypothetical protein
LNAQALRLLAHSYHQTFVNRVLCATVRPWELNLVLTRAHGAPISTASRGRSGVLLQSVPLPPIYSRRPFVEGKHQPSCHGFALIVYAKAMWLQSFHCKNGKAYLFDHVVNICCGPKEERLMTTGMHIVCDIHCSGCLYNVGWRYVRLYCLSPASCL